MQSEIPDDVMMNAERLYDEGGYKTVPEIIAEAIMAERERCEAALSAAEPSVAVKGTSEALEQFTAYFVKNYPGPDTVIFDPKWHAPKIFRAAVSALSAQVQDVAGPDRWKLVPDDATDAMVEAAANVDCSNENEMATVHNVWHAMLAAAPAAKLEEKP